MDATFSSIGLMQGVSRRSCDLPDGCAAERAPNHCASAQRALPIVCDDARSAMPERRRRLRAQQGSHVDRSLDVFFNPRGIALVGASHDPRKLGYIILDNLLRGGFAGAVYPVNLNAEPVLGLPAYQSVAAAPGEVP